MGSDDAMMMWDRHGLCRRGQGKAGCSSSGLLSAVGRLWAALSRRLSNALRQGSLQPCAHCGPLWVSFAST